MSGPILDYHKIRALRTLQGAFTGLGDEDGLGVQGLRVQVLGHKGEPGNPADRKGVRV